MKIFSKDKRVLVQPVDPPHDGAVSIRADIEDRRGTSVNVTISLDDGSCYVEIESSSLKISPVSPRHISIELD